MRFVKRCTNTEPAFVIERSRGNVRLNIEGVPSGVKEV